ncbi:MAG: autotransporter-associated beta strand repeat-containing protein, partial [Akkermansiaceae bacterium]|nr:autotransporter-associated beta strand repeat-containing protein [Armatimonadota bacterium]
ISGAGTLTKIGAGAVTLSGTNTFTGATTITSGVLTLGNANALQNSTVNININNGLDTNGQASATIGSLAGTGGLNLGTTSLAAGGNNASTTYSGVLSGSTSLTKSGTGKLTLTGANTYTGNTTVSTGTLQVGSSGTAGSIVGDVSVGTGANLTFNRSDNITFGNVISGAGSVTHNGGGILTLTGTNTYTGVTTVNLGTLQIEGSLASTGSVSVSSGSTIAGSGTVGNLTMSSGAILSPGYNGINAFHTNSVMLNSGAIWNIELGMSGTSDQVIAANAFSFSASGIYTVNFFDGTVGDTLQSSQVVGQTYRIARYESGNTNYNPSQNQLQANPGSDLLGVSGTFGTSNSDGYSYLTFTPTTFQPVPTLPAWLAFPVGAGVMALMSRRKSRRKLLA